RVVVPSVTGLTGLDSVGQDVTHIVLVVGIATGLSAGDNFCGTVAVVAHKAEFHQSVIMAGTSGVWLSLPGVDHLAGRPGRHGGQQGHFFLCGSLHGGLSCLCHHLLGWLRFWGCRCSRQYPKTQGTAQSCGKDALDEFHLYHVPSELK